MTIQVSENQKSGRSIDYPKDRRPSRPEYLTTRREIFFWHMGFDPPTDRNECWDWTGSTNNSGYGIFTFEGRHVPAHRLAHEIYNGPIVGGLHVLHSCDRPICVNPGHLRMGTPKDNTRDSVMRGRVRSSMFTQEAQDRIVSLRRQGMTLQELADICQCSPATILRIVGRKFDTPWRKDER